MACLVPVDSQHMTATPALWAHQALKCGSSQVRSKISVLKRHIRAPKVRRLQRALRRRRKTLPRDQRLRPARRAGGVQSVVQGEDAQVLDERARPGQGEAAAGAADPVAVLRGAHGDDVGRGGRRGAGQPHDGALPVVAVAEAVRGLVFGHVPGGKGQLLFEVDLVRGVARGAVRRY